ncbi:MAG: hypothetical protein JO086_00185 [Acidimicrobiia bacterium]|nr:hypothetical protein [Acidimicrobiia bacterium]
MGLSLGRKRSDDSPAAALYERLAEEINALSAAEQLALVRAFQHGTPWTKLLPRLRAVFDAVVE